MKLKLPHREVILDTSLDLEKRKEIVEKILKDIVEYNGKNITLEEYFRETWNSKSTSVCLDIMGYYLIKKYKKRDRSIISRKKHKQMKNNNKHYINFSNLSKRKQIELGIKDYEDDLDEFEN